MDDDHTAPNSPLRPVNMFRSIPPAYQLSGFSTTEPDPMLPVEAAAFQQPDFADSVDTSCPANDIPEPSPMLLVEAAAFQQLDFADSVDTSCPADDILDYTVVTAVDSSDDSDATEDIHVADNEAFTCKTSTNKHKVNSDTESMDSYNISTVGYSSVADDNIFGNHADEHFLPGTVINPPPATVKQELIDDTPLIDRRLGTDEQIIMNHGNGVDESQDEVMTTPVNSVIKQEPINHFDTIMGTSSEHEHIKEEPTGDGFAHNVVDLNAISSSIGVSGVSEIVWFGMGATSRGDGALECQSCSVLFKDRIGFLDHMFFCKGRHLWNNSQTFNQEEANMNNISMINEMEVQPKKKGRKRKLSQINDNSKAMPEARTLFQRTYNRKSTGISPKSGCLYRDTIGHRAADLTSDDDTLNNHLMTVHHSKCTECRTKYFRCQFPNCAFIGERKAALTRHMGRQHERIHCDCICAYKRRRTDNTNNPTVTMKDSLDSKTGKKTTGRTRKHKQNVLSTASVNLSSGKVKLKKNKPTQLTITSDENSHTRQQKIPMKTCSVQLNKMDNVAKYKTTTKKRISQANRLKSSTCKHGNSKKKVSDQKTEFSKSHYKETKDKNITCSNLAAGDVGHSLRSSYRKTTTQSKPSAGTSKTMRGNKTTRALLQKKVRRKHQRITKAVEHKGQKHTTTNNSGSLKDESEIATASLTQKPVVIENSLQNNKTTRALLQKKVRKKHSRITKAARHKGQKHTKIATASLTQKPVVICPDVFKCDGAKCEHRVFSTKQELKSHLIVEHPQRRVPKVVMPLFTKAEKDRLINSQNKSLDGKKLKFLNALTKQIGEQVSNASQDTKHIKEQAPSEHETLSVTINNELEGKSGSTTKSEDDEKKNRTTSTGEDIILDTGDTHTTSTEKGNASKRNLFFSSYRCQNDNCIELAPFATRTEMQDHIKSHHMLSGSENVDVFTCKEKQCDFVCNKVENMRTHKKDVHCMSTITHTQDTHNTTSTEKGNTSKRNLLFSSYRCQHDNCIELAPFATRTEMQDHIKSHHMLSGFENVAVFTCKEKQCDFVCNKEENMRTHKKDVHCMSTITHTQDTHNTCTDNNANVQTRENVDVKQLFECNVCRLVCETHDEAVNHGRMCKKREFVDSVLRCGPLFDRQNDSYFVDKLQETADKHNVVNRSEIGNKPDDSVRITLDLECEADDENEERNAFKLENTNESGQGTANVSEQLNTESKEQIENSTNINAQQADEIVEEEIASDASECSSGISKVKQLSTNAVTKTLPLPHGKYTCKYCDQTFLSATVFLIHVKTSHIDCDTTDATDGSFKCRFCNLKFTVDNTQRYHEKLFHGDKYFSLKKYPFRCLHRGCRKFFATKDELDEHIGAHEEFIHECNLDGCTRVFRHLKGLMKHKTESHANKCQHCSFETTNYKFLLKHLDESHSKRGFMCQESGCGKYFVSAETLKAHITTSHWELNKNLLPYRCSYKDCTLSFMYKKDLCKHIFQEHRAERMRVTKLLRKQQNIGELRKSKRDKSKVQIKIENTECETSDDEEEMHTEPVRFDTLAMACETSSELPTPECFDKVEIKQEIS